jgi:hypothetical protein
MASGVAGAVHARTENRSQERRRRLCVNKTARCSPASWAYPIRQLGANSAVVTVPVLSYDRQLMARQAALAQEPTDAIECPERLGPVD